jgi:hypothetical protein
VQDDRSELKIVEPELLEPSQAVLVQHLPRGEIRNYVRCLIAALGSIPWIGGFIAVSASLTAEREQQGSMTFSKCGCKSTRRRSPNSSDGGLEDYPGRELPIGEVPFHRGLLSYLAGLAGNLSNLHAGDSIGDNYIPVSGRTDCL